MKVNTTETPHSVALLDTLLLNYFRVHTLDRRWIFTAVGSCSILCTKQVRRRRLSGVFPFQGSSAKEVLAMNKACDIRFPEYLWSTISKEAKDFVLELTNKDPKLRPSALEALDDPWLRKYVKSESSQTEIPVEYTEQEYTGALLTFHRSIEHTSDSYGKVLARSVVNNFSDSINSTDSIKELHTDPAARKKKLVYTLSS